MALNRDTFLYIRQFVSLSPATVSEAKEIQRGNVEAKIRKTNRN